MLKILQHDKIWGQSPAPNSGGLVTPPSPPWSTPMPGGNIRDEGGGIQGEGNVQIHHQLATASSVDSMLRAHPDCNCVCRFVQSGRAGTIRLRSTLFLHGVCMLRGGCAHEQHVRTVTVTLTHTITAYPVSGNVVRVRILICATRQKPCRKRVYLS